MTYSFETNSMKIWPLFNLDSQGYGDTEKYYT